MVERREADIIINGVTLSFVESMTLRVAMSSFISVLSQEGCGDDEVGKKICKNYINSSHRIIKIIHLTL